jgi:hypothetical protein
MSVAVIIAKLVKGTTPTEPPPTSGGYIVEQLTANAAFQARDGLGLVSFEGKLRIMGGWNTAWNPVTTKEEWESSNGINWTQLPLANWNLPRHSFGYGVKDGAIYVWGNDVYNKTDKSVYKYTTALGWQYLGQMNLPGNWTMYMHTVHNGYLYILGGQTGQSPQWGDTFNNECYRSADGVTWTKISDLPAGMGNRANGTMLSFNGDLYVMGGGEYWSNAAHTYKSDVWKSTNNGASWAQILTSSIFDDQYPNSCVFHGRMWYLKGANKNRTTAPNGNAQGLYYSTNGTEWTRLTGDTIMPARHASAIVVHGTAMYIVAGNLWNDAYKISVF